MSFLKSSAYLKEINPKCNFMLIAERCAEELMLLIVCGCLASEVTSVLRFILSLEDLEIQHYLVLRAGRIQVLNRSTKLIKSGYKPDICEFMSTSDLTNSCVCQMNSPLALPLIFSILVSGPISHLIGQVKGLGIIFDSSIFFYFIKSISKSN